MEGRDLGVDSVCLRDSGLVRGVEARRPLSNPLPRLSRIARFRTSGMALGPGFGLVMAPKEGLESLEIRDTLTPARALLNL